ncbi:MAG: hypothetical protein E7365_00995 [Clostridiales bacterium]|nr:hypothetical protein [Clostridiales bacterium]
MSVVKSKRGEGQLVVITKAEELAEYSVKICKNEKHFPKAFRWCFTMKIVDEAVSIYTLIREANTIFVTTKEDYSLRRRKQLEALSLTDSLLGLIDLAKRVYGLDSDRVEHWALLVKNVSKPLRKWLKSDEERYKDIG